MLICICAFNDKEPNSQNYKKFFNVDDAVAFYKKRLLDDNVQTISTRKVMDKPSEFNTNPELFDSPIVL